MLQVGRKENKYWEPIINRSLLSSQGSCKQLVSETDSLSPSETRICSQQMQKGTESNNENNQIIGIISAMGTNFKETCTILVDY